jgi:hypothetical protein
MSCDKSDPVTSTGYINNISFLDKGGVVAYPITTVVTIDPCLIKFIKTQKGNTIDFWVNKISTEDYSRLSSIVSDNKLMDAPDPVLPPGVSGCIGNSGMTIVMKKQNLIDTLDISGNLMCGAESYWPAGLHSLLVLKDSLVNKYKP